MRPRTLNLDEERHAALARVRDRDPRPYLRERAAALLKIARGQSIRAVALRGLGKRRKPDTVRGWLDAYRDGGLPALVQRPRGHRGFSPSARGGTGRDGAPAA